MSDTLSDRLLGNKSNSRQISDEDLNNPNVQKYLQYINTYEGKPANNQTVGYHSFNDLSDHPRISVKFNNKGDTSDAAGSYQLLSTTWDDQKKKQGLTDFSPVNQQRAALGLLRDKGVLEDLKNGDYDKVNSVAKNIWASIPGSKIGESTGQFAKVKPEAEQLLKTTDSGDSLSDALLGKRKKTSQPTSQQTNQQQPQTFTQPNQSEYKGFLSEFSQPIKDISWEGFKKSSIIPKLATGMTGNLQDKLALEKQVEQGVGNFIGGVQEFAKHPLESIGSLAKEVYEHPASMAGRSLGSTVKGAVEAPETLLPGVGIGAKALQRTEKIAELAPKIAEVAETKPRFTIKEGKIVPKETLDVVTPEEIQTGTSKKASPDYNFSEPYYGEKELPIEEQRARAETLSRIDPNLKVHENVIKGLGKDRATQYQVSKTDTELGNLYKQQFTDEKNALNKFGDKLVKDTGGTFGLDESAKYKSGNIILDPLKKLETYFDKKTSDLYKLRDAQAKEIPVTANNILNDINNLIRESKRPIIIAGNGIKIGHCIKKFESFLDKYNITFKITLLTKIFYISYTKKIIKMKICLKLINYYYNFV